MGLEIPVVRTLRAMAIDGDDGALASLLPLLYTHPIQVNLEDHMALKLRCVDYILRRHAAGQIESAQLKAAE